ncbi:DUF4249 domain-containing protein [Dyadobacter chenwenxiniae]|uniref:DUF4249 domain-containing protein n=1 Tax=Dyadobacter chenwenxiniae TaxID=2906456 RepID=A0A9X1PR21_9BACT|nr:DUF4249 domain-containing protein [Dyadobacter chenwenxiniae]MCF0051263.1 DUF4249 domain-containing protein [Dyadobacter chenwenxiniae]MCF0065371.1 DUF4249 domain-containing protein [Dyadobacter chenwenxiniae]UON82217.1 DUF4249 domain-containing protein [Dyadobacter chenwenxiniae]
MKKISDILFIKKIAVLPVLLASLIFLSGCEDVIDLETETGPQQLVVDGWVTNQPGPQTIKLNWSAGYFNNGPATPVLGAEVTVTDDKGKVFKFEDLAGNGQYIWGKTNTDTLGRIGRTYALQIKNQSDIYTASSELKRVPTVDSIVYRKEKLPFEPDKGPKEGYVAQFYARDFVGEGDTYWIKPLVNGKPATEKAVNISIAYDAAFGAGAPSDGLIFILPIRESLTVDSLYSAGASVGVELHSISNETFEFLKQIREQAANGGLFAVPNSNIKSNVKNSNPNGMKALGFFSASAVSRKQTIIDPEKARPDED